METIKRIFLNIGIVIVGTVCSTLWWSYFAWSTASWFGAKDVAAIQLDATLAAMTITPCAIILGMLVNAAREAKAKLH
ncbi:hypothetical protein PAGU2196_23160 [Pseudomonas sp. PAGU 2196]|uniref:hypothetical protein n=1 Tax=Pseudomonas sp. PAGU 2196 TaxID=2793997 RepID=UPI001EE06A3F|nr:hypothetical protein [Pseudomonas sp. PAGU 2196]GHS81482.1 hypothetical protein PAGU2196_23160 [Pseudomonas sp. PAGU 2196]